MSTAQTLRRIDDEITTCRQEIARQQVNIARLEDTRRVLMGLEEADQTAQQMRKEDRQSVIAGSSARPMLVVRRIAEDAPPVDPASAPMGVVTAGPRKGLPRMRPARGKGKPSVSGSIRQRILEFLQPGDEPISSHDLGNNLGIPMGEEARKPMSNALYQLRANGAIQRDEQKRYYRPAAAQDEAEAS